MWQDDDNIDFAGRTTNNDFDEAGQRGRGGYIWARNAKHASLCVQIEVGKLQRLATGPVESKTLRMRQPRGTHEHER